MPTENLPAAVIFDMDGVIADTEPLHAESHIAALRRMGLHYTMEQYRRDITLGHMNLNDVYLSLGGDLARWEEELHHKTVLMRQLMAEKGALLPGVLDLLRLLQQAGIPTAIATGAGTRSLGVLLDRFDIGGYFRCFVTWQDVQSTKPSPDLFLTAASRLEVRSEECVALEDSPRGVLAAHRAGMKCIAVPTSWTADGDLSPATVIVDSMERVDLAMLRGLFQD